MSAFNGYRRRMNAGSDTMRVLALHGIGTSASILKKQLAPLVNELGPNFEFVFVDGVQSAWKGPGLGSSESGPYYAYTTEYTPSALREAYDDLAAIIDDEGPFDGVLGFSQGASMAAGFLVEQERRRPGKAPPFRFAIFMSSVAAFSSDDSYGSTLIREMLLKHRDALKFFPKCSFETLDDTEKIFAQYLALTFQSARAIGAFPAQFEIDFFRSGKPEMIPRVLHPSLLEHRIHIPTVHVRGLRDHPLMIAQARTVQELCEPSSAKVVEHSGGHSLPWKKMDVEALAKAIQWSIGESLRERMVRQAFRYGVL